MNLDRLFLLFWCISAGLLAYVLLQIYSARQAPLYKKFELQWAADVELLEKSPKLPAVWKDVHDVQVIGGTPETKAWLRRIQVPITVNPKGKNHMEILVVAWEENGKRGVLLQYNIEDRETKNTLLELSRNLILSKPEPAPKNAFSALIEEFRQ